MTTAEIAAGGGWTIIHILKLAGFMIASIWVLSKVISALSGGGK